MAASAWTAKKTMDGVVYYYNVDTKDVSWDEPISDSQEDTNMTWIPHPTEVWQPAKIVGTDPETGGTMCETLSGEKVVVPKSGKMQESLTAGRVQMVPMWPLKKSELNHLEDDLIMIENVNDGSIIHNLEQRYINKQLYTFVGASHRILVSVNPYQRLPLYGDDVVKTHRDKSPNIDLPPHVFDIANDSYDEMLFEGKHQSILISGESGAGKTEATKQCLKFWAKVAGSKNGVEDRLIQANPVLEAYGNAKTIRNNNSSRFGKWQEVYFDQLARSIDGALIINYLLEKSRLVFQQAGERNFHIFYQLMSDAGMRSKYELLPPAENRFTLKGITTPVDGIDDVKDFADARQGMRDLEFSEAEQEWLLRLPAAILHLGNVTFENQAQANNVRGSKITDMKPLKALGSAAKFLGVADDKLTKVLLYRTIVVKGETSVIPLDTDHARTSCDSIAKGIYGRMFDWLIQRCNQSLKGDTTGKFIGVLDIFGFEIFDVNSFEQLCINFCNEKLQQLFNKETFKDEEELYAREGIKFKPIKFIDSEPVLAMIEKPPNGILPALDDECLVPEGNDHKFMAKIEESFSHHPNFATDKHRKLNNQLAFEIVHYAGTVKYTADEFMVKNRDQFYQDAYDLLAGSSDPLTKALFPPLDARIQTKSLSSVFRQQLAVLMNKLNTTSTRYVRCIKPNDSMSPLLFEAPLVLRQLRYSGVFEAVEIRKQGFPFRHKYEAFSFRYKAINPDHLYTASNGDPKAVCKEILDAAPSDFSEVVFGQTMLFYRAFEYKKLKLLRALALETIIPRVQGILRGASARAIRRRIKGEEMKISDALENTPTDQAKMKAIRDNMDVVLGSLHARLFAQYRPRNEAALSTQIAALQQWLDFEVEMEALLKTDPNKNFAKYVDAKEKAATLSHIPRTSKQAGLVDSIVEQINTCEIGKLDAKMMEARRVMDRAAMEELLAKARDFGHSSRTVDEVARVLALDEVSFLELEAVAAKETSDGERFKTVKKKIWDLRGWEAECERARKEMNRAKMDELLGNAREFSYSSPPVEELARCVALSEKEWLKLEAMAGEEMGDSPRVKRCKMRLWEIEMGELSSSYARWQGFNGLKTPEAYAKGKWFGKSACAQGMLVADKAVVNSSLSKSEDPLFKKMAKDMNKGILAYVGCKPDPRGGDAAVHESFLIAGRSPEAKNEFLLQLLKASTPNLPKVDSATHQKAVDLLSVCAYLWPAPDPELERYLFVYMSKRNKNYAKAAVHGRFDSSSSANVRSGGDIARILKEIESMGEGGNAVALQ